MPFIQLRKRDISRFLKAAPKLADLPFKRFSIHYDSDADVLHFRFERPQHPTDSEMRDEGVIVHRRGRHVVGVTVLRASKR